MPGRYPHVLRAITETPWAVQEHVLAVIAGIVGARVAGERLTAEEIRDLVGARPPARPTYGSGAIAVLPLYGVIFPRASLMSDMSGGTSLDTWSAALAQAVADPNVAAILIDVDSPGGSVAMVPETAARIRKARQQKRVIAIANPTAASAAYWLASQADEILVTPSGEVGSIGVLTIHDDMSGMLAQAGIDRKVIASTPQKIELSPFAPLSEDGQRTLEAMVEDFYGMFVADVALGRGVDEQTVRAGFGQGRMLGAQAARREGMADGVATYEETLQRMMGAPNPGRKMGIAGLWVSASATTTTVADQDPVSEPAAEADPEAAEPAPSDEPETEPEAEPEAEPDADPDSAAELADSGDDALAALSVRRRRLDLAAAAAVDVNSRPPIR